MQVFARVVSQQKFMASFQDILKYYSLYWKTSVLSIGASSIFAVADLLVPYAIGQILNVLSGQPTDTVTQKLIGAIASVTQQPANQTLSISVLLGLIFLVTVAKAPIDPNSHAEYPRYTHYHHYRPPIEYNSRSRCDRGTRRR